MAALLASGARARARATSWSARTDLSAGGGHSVHSLNVMCVCKRDGLNVSLCSTAVVDGGRTRFRGDQKKKVALVAIQKKTKAVWYSCRVCTSSPKQKGRTEQQKYLGLTCASATCDLVGTRFSQENSCTSRWGNGVELGTHPISPRMAVRCGGPPATSPSPPRVRPGALPTTPAPHFPPACPRRRPLYRCWVPRGCRRSPRQRPPCPDARHGFHPRAADGVCAGRRRRPGAAAAARRGCCRPAAGHGPPGGAAGGGRGGAAAGPPGGWPGDAGGQRAAGGSHQRWGGGGGGGRCRRQRRRGGGHQE